MVTTVELRSGAGGLHQASLKSWSEFVSKCLTKRLDPATFESYAALLHSKHPLPPQAVAAALLRPSPADHDVLDPRVPQYLQALLGMGLVDLPAVLRALYKYSTSHTQTRAHAAAHGRHDAETDQRGDILRWTSSYGAEEVIFYRLTKGVAQGGAVKSAGDALAVARIMASWMALLAAAADAFAEDEMGQLQSSPARDEMESARAAFVMLLLSVCENQVVLGALSKPFAKDTRKQLSESLARFVPTIIQSSSQIATRLELFRTETLASFEPVDKTKAAEDAEIGEILDSTMGLESFVIPEMPIATSRAGLYIYLNAALVGRPLIDDHAFFTYLHNRYQGDLQTTAIDLILASFDLLANAVFRNEGQKAAHLLRSYLINKVPVLLATLAASASTMFPFNSEYCITAAVNQVDTNAFPPLSALFDDTSNVNPLTDGVRSEFCFACSLHGLIPETSIERLIGESPMQSVAKGYVKDELVQECLADPERMQGLIGELENMDGNVGAVCQALTEVLGRLCNNKETMSLKMLCSQLARKPLSLDVLLLFDKPAAILHPLCELLDNWRYDEDQGEYQPVYEEFGSILLLLLAFAYRYNLSAADMGIRSPDSFVAKLLSGPYLNRPLEDLSDQEKGHLDGWIHGLFDTDAGGLGDELMSSCPPQEFYLLLPTLFHQTVLAFSTNYLTEESLKGGVEYLVDTFLLPSLVPAIMYLCNHLWVDRPEDQKAILRILRLILLPNSISNEASTMLSSVLNIVAKPLEDALRSYQQKDSQEVEPLLKALKENIPLSRRTGGADHNELESWTATANGGLAASIRDKIQGFVTWSLHPAVNVMPTSYTHRQMLAGLKILGARRMLYVVLDEVKQLAAAGSGSIAFDVGTALVCAPDVASVDAAQQQRQSVSLLDEHGGAGAATTQRRLSLREALKCEAEACKRIQKADPAMAEAVVRLHRAVEAQMAEPPPGALAMLQSDLGALEGAELDMAAAAAEAAVAGGDGGLTVDTVGVDLGLGGAGDLNFGESSANSAGGLGDFGADTDMFGSGDFSGLSAGTDFHAMNWGDDGMDLS